jgi:hypothetical protein
LLPVGSSTGETETIDVPQSLFDIWIRERPPREVHPQTSSSALEADFYPSRPDFGLWKMWAEISFTTGDLAASNEALWRILDIIDRLIKQRGLFRKIDKWQLIRFLSTLVEKLPPDVLASIDDDELTRRVEKIMFIEAIAGTLNELSPVQMEAYEAAIKRRKFFK